ncbi:c582c63f-ca59-41c8-bcc5-ec511796b3d3 [Sclerotinia trifoliorum]|uniref:C582c63f-ca59-41c8-bcc5-ec511796b3d3 n=1 Tax=Sclerotinia trifoliorum TaxID=28548 RepID=A0A8H2ZUU4_9HELO|nr:c582c63f-ca59-41c8-bcc5-ec511796b3d3 [Sclerotinia trifoliorum]
MRLSQAQPQILSLLLLTIFHSSPLSASPLPKDELYDLGLSYLMERTCASPCGADSQYCCAAGDACYTSSGDIAYCSASSTAGWAVFTTTYTKTGLQVGTSTYSSYTAATTSSGSAAICDTTVGQTSCGPICCASDQMCEYSGQCTGRTSLWTYTTTTSGTYSAPLRPTSGASTKTNTVSATTTEPFIPPATASGSTLPLTGASSNNLSAGAIAGIVIGTILGVILLLLLCFCCVVKGLWDSVLGIFAGGRRSRRQEGGAVRTRIETVERISRHSRHGSAAGGAAAATYREQQTGFFGGARTDKPMRVVETRKKKSSGMGGLGAMGAGLVGMAALLGLKKKEDGRRDEKMRPGPTATETDIGSTYYTDSYTATSVSSESSDRRSRSPRRDRSARR